MTSMRFVFLPMVITTVKAHLYQLTFDEDDPISTNALWVFTHFRHVPEQQWLYAKHDDLIDRVLVEKMRQAPPDAPTFLRQAIRGRNHSVPISSISASQDYRLSQPTPSAATA